MHEPYSRKDSRDNAVPASNDGLTSVVNLSGMDPPIFSAFAAILICLLALLRL